MKSGGGFSGKGFKFDEAEANLSNEKKKFQKASLGLQDSDDDDEMCQNSVVHCVVKGERRNQKRSLKLSNVIFFSPKSYPWFTV